jgi:signal transduction histidine kinase
VRRLVQQNGGRVWIDSTTTEGTCVRLTLPALAPR